MKREYDFSKGEVGRYSKPVRVECNDCDGYGDYEGGTPGAMFTRCNKCDGKGYTMKTRLQIMRERREVAAKVRALCEPQR